MVYDHHKTDCAAFIYPRVECPEPVEGQTKNSINLTLLHPRIHTCDLARFFNGFLKIPKANTQITKWQKKAALKCAG